MVTPVAKREAVAHLGQVYEVSQRRACVVIGADRISVCYRSRKPDDEAVRSRLRELAAVRRRFGYRRLHLLLGREGLHLNHRSCGGSTLRNGFRSVAVAGASGHSEPGPR
jgi:putative transposase